MAKAPNNVGGGKAPYKLSNAYWDGNRVHPAGAFVQFAEGKAPRGAVKVSEAEASPEVGATGEGQDEE